MGLLYDAIVSTEAKTVGINRHDWTIFYSDKHPKTIGVRGLSACSVVAIVSPHAAAVAHIGPNVYGSSDHNSFIDLAERLTRDAVSTCTDNQALFPYDSKTHIVCATVNNDVITAPKQLKVMYQGLKILPHNDVRWHYYERPREDFVGNRTHFGTVFVDGRGGIPRVYVEDRDITNAPGNSPMWYYNGAYQLKLGTLILEETINPPLNEWIYDGEKWVKWNGESWL